MNTEKRKLYNLKQLNVEIPIDMHNKIKFAAKRRNIPMRTWILRSLYKTLTEET